MQAKLEELLARHEAHEVAIKNLHESRRNREYMYDLKGPEMWPQDREARREWVKELVPEFEPPTKFPEKFVKWKPIPSGF